MTPECLRENDVLEAIGAARWPDRVETDLRDHVETCAVCRDVAVVATALVEDHECAWAEAAVPQASAVWWRSQIRAREEAARLAARPIVVVQALATVCVFAASAALAPAASGWVRDAIGTLGPSGWSSLQQDVSLSWILGTAAYMTIPLLAVGLWLILAPVVVYLALDD